MSVSFHKETGSEKVFSYICFNINFILLFILYKQGHLPVKLEVFQWHQES